MPPPHLIKQGILRSMARSFELKVLVETGTFYGDMIWALKGDFERIYSIELDQALHRRAARRFSAASHVTILHGDSATELAKVLPSINAPVLFWLDGHYSGGETSKGAKATPVFEELSLIFRSNLDRFVVLVDDARLFGSDPSYPTVEGLRDFVQTECSGAEFWILDDAIRIVPPSVHRSDTFYHDVRA